MEKPAITEGQIGQVTGAERPVKESKLLSAELVRRLAEDNLSRKANRGVNAELEADFPDRFSGSWGGVKVEAQFVGGGSEDRKGLVFSVEERNGSVRESKVKARVWLSETSEQEGEGLAVCYVLDQSGEWYKQEATTYRYDKARDTNYWSLGKAAKVTGVESRIQLENVLKLIPQPEGELDDKLKTDEESPREKHLHLHPILDEKFPPPQLTEAFRSTVMSGNIEAFSWLSIFRESPAKQIEAEVQIGRFATAAVGAGRWVDLPVEFDGIAGSTVIELSDGLNFDYVDVKVGRRTGWNLAAVVPILVESGLAREFQDSEGKKWLEPTENLVRFINERMARFTAAQ